MKTRLTVLLATLCCLLAVAAFRVGAQSDRRMALEVPFDFIVKEKKLPAGRYTVERLNQGNPSILVLKAINGSAKRVFSTQGAEADGMGNLSELVFTRYGEDRFLSKIWWGGDPNGRQLPRGDAERAWGGRGVEQRVIALKKK